MIAVDFEYVAENAVEGRRPDVEKEYCEIMQIGACRLDETGAEQATLNIVVKSHRIASIPEWLQDLTGIDDKRREQDGVTFETALKQLSSFAARAEVWTYSGDWFVLNGNLKAHGLSNPFKRPFHRARVLMDQCAITKERFDVMDLEMCSGDLHRVLGIPLPRIEASGSSHDASYDARSLAHSVFAMRRAYVIANLAPKDAIQAILAPPRLVPMNEFPPHTDLVGWIGLGSMGAPMATHAALGGFQLQKWNRSNHAMKTVETIAEACRGARFVCSMLSNDAATRECFAGESGILAHMEPDAIYINFSTLSRSLVEDIERECLAKGRMFVNCPVFGRPDAAAAGKLFLMPGGEKSAVARCIPLLHSIGQKSFPLASCSLSAIAKANVNFCISGTIEMLSEAFCASERAGIPPEFFLDILVGTDFGRKIFNGYGALIAGEKFEPAGFTMELGLKDINLFLSVCEELHVPAPVAACVKNRLLEGLAQGGAQLDWSAMSRFVRKSAGLG